MAVLLLKDQLQWAEHIHGHHGPAVRVTARRVAAVEVDDATVKVHSDSVDSRATTRANKGEVAGWDEHQQLPSQFQCPHLGQMVPLPLSNLIQLGSAGASRRATLAALSCAQHSRQPGAHVRPTSI